MLVAGRVRGLRPQLVPEFPVEGEPVEQAAQLTSRLTEAPPWSVTSFTAPEGVRRYGRSMRIPTAAITAGSLIGGWQLARRTGIRPLGGVALAAGGVVAGREWARRTSPTATGALVATYLGAFGLSHPLARRIGSWPAVLTAAAVTAAASYVVADRRPPR